MIHHLALCLSTYSIMSSVWAIQPFQTSHVLSCHQAFIYGSPCPGMSLPYLLFLAVLDSVVTTTNYQPSLENKSLEGSFESRLNESRLLYGYKNCYINKSSIKNKGGNSYTLIRQSACTRGTILDSETFSLQFEDQNGKCF